jgi:predicted RNase H-like nuclease
MAVFIGIDGIPGGWVAVYLNSDGQQYFRHAEFVYQLLVEPYQRAMVDMPIGLPESGYRPCDVEARARVGSRVFLGARSGVWRFATLDQANAHYWKCEGPRRGISMQLFCIRDKLKQLNDAPVSPKLFESHPELVFFRLAGRVLESKKTETGRQQRIKLLKAKGICDVHQWLGQRRGTRIGRDDLIDACACALSARESIDKLPAEATSSDGPRPMEIWY